MEGFTYAWQALTGSWAVSMAAVGGVIWGVLGGALPGISPSIAMAMLLPFTYGMDPIAALVLLGAVYVGAEYGGSIPAILIRTPGTNAAAATVFDGYELHKKGRGGEALGISLIAGVTGGFIGLVFLVLFTQPLASVALAFSFPAFFALGILGLSVIASLGDGSLIKSLIAGVLGLMIATIGTDPLSGVNRFTFGEAGLSEGIPFVLIMIGLFAVSELMFQTYAPPWERTSSSDTRIKLPSFKTWRSLWKAQGIGSALGIFEGCTPGGGGSIAAFMSYNEAKRWSKTPEEFGKGSLEGIAAPEASNNTVTSTALVPVLTFGIPGSNSAAVLMGGMLIHGLQPGPLLFQKSPEIIYGLFGGLFLANLAQLFIGIAILTPAIWLVNRPKPYLMAAILALVFSGVYSIDNSVFDLFVVLVAGVIGYVMRLLGFSFLPMVLGLVLGYLIESNYRRALEVSSGDHMIFIQDPISLGLLLASIGFIAFSIARDLRVKAKKTAH